MPGDAKRITPALPASAAGMQINFAGLGRWSVEQVMAIKLGVHGEQRLIERQIARAWIEATVLPPDWRSADPDPSLTRSYKAIAGFGGRILRVVHRSDGDDISW